MPSDIQWEKMKKFIKSDKYKKEDFFVFETLAVGDRIVPNRYIKIMPELLEVMKEDADKGVSLMLNHNWSQVGVQSIPIGKVFSGEIRGGTQDGEENALFVQQYILRDDSKVDGYSKNDIINLIETGIIADTSVGWGTTRDSYKCSICKNNYYSGDCRHWQGQKYIVNEQTEEVKTCIVEAYAPTEKHAGNNVLMENSVVFDGAYPNAVIQSAAGNVIDTPNGQMNFLNEKEDVEENSIITAYSFKDDVVLMYQKNTEKGGKTNMQGEENKEKLSNDNLVEEEVVKEQEVIIEEQEVDVQETQVESEETEVLATSENSVIIKSYFSDEEIMDIFGTEKVSKEKVISLLKEGKEYREKTIEEALSNGVKLLGNSFDKESFEITFNNLEVNKIKDLSEAWKKQSDEMFSEERISQDRERGIRENNTEENIILANDNLKTLKY